MFDSIINMPWILKMPVLNILGLHMVLNNTLHNRYLKEF